MELAVTSCLANVGAKVTVFDLDEVLEDSDLPRDGATAGIVLSASEAKGAVANLAHTFTRLAIHAANAGVVPL